MERSNQRWQGENVRGRERERERTQTVTHHQQWSVQARAVWLWPRVGRRAACHRPQPGHMCWWWSGSAWPCSVGCEGNLQGMMGNRKCVCQHQVEPQSNGGHDWAMATRQSWQGAREPDLWPPPLADKLCYFHNSHWPSTAKDEEEDASLSIYIIRDRERQSILISCVFFNAVFLGAEKKGGQF